MLPVFLHLFGAISYNRTGRNKEVTHMFRKLRHTIGLVALSFGLGILIATLLPSWFLVAVMALLTAIAGFCILKC